MKTTRIDEIRERRLSQSELKRMAALAGEEAGEGNFGASETLSGGLPPGAETATGAAAKETERRKPNKIEELAGEYFDNMQKKYGDRAACALTVACMNLEAAALIAKTIRECIGGQSGIKK